jgi:hypothetical protein
MMPRTIPAAGRRMIEKTCTAFVVTTRRGVSSRRGAAVNGTQLEVAGDQDFAQVRDVELPRHGRGGDGFDADSDR